MHFARQCLTTVALGVALWLSLGTLAVTGDHPAIRIAVLPPFWMLGVTGLLGIIAGFWRSTPHRWLLIAPAALLVLPWLPLPAGVPIAPSTTPQTGSLAAALAATLAVGAAAPAALSASVFIWLGPVVTLVWATLGIAWLADVRVPRLARERTPVPARALWPGAARLVQHPLQAPLLAALCAFALFLFGAWQLSPWLPDGDEPHYLVIAQSLLHDGDLQIENNHRAGQYREYSSRDLKPDYLQRGTNNQIYSIHAPGLPALILPAFAIGGYRAVAIFLALVAALGTALAWRVCWLVTGRASAAWIGWAAVTGSAPFFFHAFTVFPDGVASVIVLTGVLALVRAAEMTTTRAWLHGLALALLPWLHTRYAILAATMGLLIVWRFAQTQTPAQATAPAPTSAPAPARMRRIAAFLAMPACSAIAWFAFFYAIYGTINPAAPYGSAAQGSWQTLPAGVAGLLIDQQFGLIVNAPIYLVSLGGLIWMLRRRGAAGAGSDADTHTRDALFNDVTSRDLAATIAREFPQQRRLALEMAIIAVPYALATAAYPMWWGGWSAPARFLVPLVLMFSVPVAVVWTGVRTQTMRAAVGVALGITIWLTLFLLSIHRGRIVYNERDGFALWADWAGPVADLALGLPSLFRAAWPRAMAEAAVWAAALCGMWALLRVIERRTQAFCTPARTPLFMTAIVPAACGVAGMIGFAGVWAINGSDGLRTLSLAADARRAGLFRPVTQRGMHYASTANAVDVFAISEGISLEPGGFWIEPARERALLVVSTPPTPASGEPAAAPLRLALRNGPIENRVSVVSDRWRRDLTLAPDAEIMLEMPAARSGRTLVRMQVAHGVRPSDHDPASADHRLLGLWVAPR